MQEKFKTTDLYEAAFLYTVGCKFLGLEPAEEKNYFFVFDDFQLCKDLLFQYYNLTAEVKAKDYADSLKTLKDILFREKGIKKYE